MFRCALFAAALALGACATTPGPVSLPDFPALVAAAAPGEDILVSGPGTWTANSRRILEMQNTGGSLLPGYLPWKDGVTIITASGLSFAEWDAATRAYVVIKRIGRADMASVDLTVEGRSCALVVQEARDATFHVFEFTRGVMNDCATARLAVAALS